MDRVGKLKALVTMETEKYIRAERSVAKKKINA
jgi:hypothetical protein